MKQNYFIILICGFLLALLTMILPLASSGNFRVDYVVINRISHQLKASWPQAVPGDFLHYPYHFSFIDEKGHLLFATSVETAQSITEAIQEHDIILDMETGDGTKGTLLIRTGITDFISKKQKQLVFILVIFALLFTASAILYWTYISRKLLKPFQKLQTFAGRIAAGNLDIPLEMDRDHLFGAFTESFDLMRDKLAEAKKSEALANQSKKELIASLSHDIKTPVTSIKLISELLLVKGTSENRDKISAIYKKAEQIDQLVTNLFQSAMEELQQLKVHLKEMESPDLMQFFRDADYYGRLHCEPVPGCILHTDPLRLMQVIDNVISNSYKYADTSIDVSSELLDNFLHIRIRDFGPGVKDEELNHLFEKFYRGSKAVQSHLEGAGLGLYLSSYLMERMDGEITCSNLGDGFLVSLLIPLAAN